MNTPYLVGRRTTAKTPATDQQGCRPQGCRQQGRDTSNLRAEDSGRAVLLTLGWGFATFGAGAVLGWAATRKASALESENAAS